MRLPRTARRAAAAVAAACLVVPASAAADDLSFVKAPGSPLDTALTPRDSVVADFDGDGHGDIVVGDNSGPLKVLWGAADGGVAQTTTIPGAAGDHIAVGNLDGDADLDFAVAEAAITVVRYTGPRTFTVGTPIPVGTGGQSFNAAGGLAIADFNQQNGNDIAFTAQDLSSASVDGRLRILVNNGTGAFSLVTPERPDDDYVEEVVTGRFNNDSDPDLAYRYTVVGTTSSDHRVRVLLGGSGATFTESSTFTAGPTDFYGDLAAGRLDGPADLYDDIVAQGSVRVHWANGNGTFTATTIDPDAGGDLRIGDLTGDGLLDVVAVDRPLKVLANRGSRVFAVGHTLTFPDEAYGINANVGDLGGDGRDDLVVTFEGDDDDFDDELYKLLTTDPGQPNPFGTTTTTPPPGGGTQPPPGGGGPFTPAPIDVAPIPTPAPTPSPGPVVIPVKTSQIARLPSNRRCASRRNFRIRLRRPPEGVAVREARVLVNGKRVRVVRGARLTAPVDLRGLPKGRVTVTIRITLADGRVLRGTRRYKTCATRKTRGGRFDPKKKG